MIIDLKKIFVNENSSLPLEYSLDMSNLEYMGCYPLKKPVVLSGVVSNKASLVRLEASISYEYDAPCDRCGIDAKQNLKVSLDKSLAVRTESEESDTILVIPDMKLDLEELIYSEVVVNLPMKHLCREDCKGICFRCGKNLNEGECGCSKKEIDPRLSALAALLNDE